MGPPGGRYYELSPTDRALALFDRRCRMSFHIVLELDGRLDAGPLAAAWSAVVDRHPILTAVVEPDRARARWRPFAARPPFAAVEEPGVDRSSSATVAAIVDSSLDVETGPVARLALARCADGDAIVLSTHHAALDGPAAVMLLAEIRDACWSAAAGEALDRYPTQEVRTLPHAAERAGLDLATRRAIVGDAVQRWREVPRSAHPDAPLAPRPTASYRTLGSEATEAIAAVRRNGPWSATTALLCASARAWDSTFGPAASAGPTGGRSEPANGIGGASGGGTKRVGDRAEVAGAVGGGGTEAPSDGAAGIGPGPSGWLVTGDLRRRLAITGGIGNLSGTEPVVLTGLDRPGRTLLDDCQARLDELRDGYPGLAADLATEGMGALPGSMMRAGLDLALSGGTERLRLTRTFSNFGVFPDPLVSWPGAEVEVLWSGNPGGDAPFTNLGWSTLGGRITLSSRGVAHLLAEPVTEALVELAAATEADRSPGSSRSA